MSDFDFDELDKAVAGVLSTEPEAAKPDTEALDDTNMEKDVPVVSAPRESESDQRDIAPAARRTSGRFMDVVHPSSDMRTRSTPAFIGASPVSTEKSFTPPSSNQEHTEAPATTQGDSLEAAANEWSKPLESPFLSDAKVEKRPLGGFGPDPSQAKPAQVLLEAPEEELKLEASDEPLLEASYPDPIDFAAQSAALPIEKEDTGGVQPEDEPFVEATNTLGDFEVTQTTEVTETAKAIESAEPVRIIKPETEVPAGPMSITQQYTEQPAAAQQSGAIFDTENYHKPLTVAPKKHSGLLTIVWILLLVILGAGAGVAFYLFVLPML